MTPAVDIAIVGGGMVGASLAVAVAPLGLKVALIEAVAHDSASQPSFDERTTALSNGSCRILQTLGVWAQVQTQAVPIRKIHVSDQGRFGFARIDAAEQGLTAMGYVVPNRALGLALWSRGMACPHIQVHCPAQVLRIERGERTVALEIAAAGAAAGATADATARIDARLVVAADGVHSAVRGAFGVDVQTRDYEQTAIITTVLPQRFHDHVAYERFSASGPLALLPLDGGRCALVLTLNRAAAEAAMAWSDGEFLAEVQRRFGFRLGRFLKVGRRVPYPLSLTRAERTSAERCVIIGNAAQSLHPVAGMGFNLGLRDVASLAELLAEHRREPSFDAGAAGLLAEYDAWRAADRAGVLAFTDGLVRLFANPSSVVARLRNIGLLAFDLLPPAKAALSSLSAGGGGRTRIPKLARGVALQ
ncbi:MAG TPA: 2-octaprenyl-6-methoxyphenyl hydroxylase [Steroidobacteraceae bacterium]|nr:2-octaprenyl-6-methoxyphenyl hydroxylase [Steroidobacteraceae bacterium]